MWLAFDIGTTGVKAALVTGDARIQHSAYRDYPTRTAEGGIVEQDANDWLQAVVDTIGELSTSQDWPKVEAIALTGQMQNVILVDANGEPARPVILYSDTRARAEADEINQKFGDRLRQMTGNNQDASGLLAKLRWLELQDELQKAAGLLIGAADFIAFKLTGAYAADTTTASTTGLMDIRTRAWLNDSDFRLMGIHWPSFPALIPGGKQVGVLTQETADALDLKAGLPVYLGPGDAGATTIGAGSGETGFVYGYLGESGWVGFTSGTIGAPENGVTLAHPRSNQYIQVAPLMTAGGNLDWVRDLFGMDNYDPLIAQALATPLSNLLYLPYLNGERVPFSDPLARGAFIGLTPRTAKADIYRAVLEGVALAYRHALESLVSMPVKVLTMTGGGTRSRPWCQLFADVLNVPVMLGSDKEFVGVRGAVLAAEVTLGARRNYRPEDFFPTAQMLRPTPRSRDHYDRKYSVYQAAYPALKPVYAALDGV